MGSLGDFAQFAGIEERSQTQLDREFRRWFNVGKGFTDAPEQPETPLGTEGTEPPRTRAVLAAGEVAVEALERRKEVNVDQFLADLEESEIELWKLLRVILNSDIRLFEGAGVSADAPDDAKLSNKEFVFGIFKRINPGLYRSESRVSEEAELKEPIEEEAEPAEATEAVEAAQAEEAEEAETENNGFLVKSPTEA